MPLDPVRVARVMADGLSASPGLSVVCADSDRLDYSMPRKDPEARRAYQKRYSAQNAERLKAQKRAWFQKRMQEPAFRAANNARACKWAKENTLARLAIVARSEAKNAVRLIRSRRNAKLKKDHGITCDEYDALLAEQGGGCAICGSPTANVGKREYLFVDHDHTTEQIRGLLCNDCNFGLARFKDNPELLRQGASYLERSKRCLIRSG